MVETGGDPALGGAQRRDPERTRAQILSAAIVEFAENGFGGARIDEIAARAGANKRMIYHYFGNKEALFGAVLEHMYHDIRGREADLHLEDMDPQEGMRRLVEFSFSYYTENPHFIRLLNTENECGARHLKQSARIRQLHSPLVRMIETLLRRGAEAGVFRRDIDPVQLYISIAGMGYFYFSNIHTLSTIFDVDLAAPQATSKRVAHMVDAVLGYLRP